ncbi:23S rRNA (pseudouridine1915-N3)-methyltransferase [Tistlia consotensis]|uniref:Ribosomal RNA large subunit methyltransferase H n=1 Tax=Tistlia consotensis USBA 355 TaxID=560819 RepID=A0A1Y6BMB6_9PROT|nr:23S rRNA (pseudouridine(1915)-N(3))-methyltransferase RlmH [Tistlia consotensis]SMF08138.1 23S rRNA (pseudouridine1915-N3)-methyltransferase [Tistlia consotensis USBA 355]SNR35520.1 23S rRNA (pseudouridine1915-N3)-methyltransferase [Tistlia consotensis]
MRLHLLAVGRLRGGPMAALYDDYARRLRGQPLGPLDLREVEEKRPLAAAALKAREAGLLLEACPSAARLVALDGGGRTLSSEALAETLGRWRDEGVGDAAFAIGGAEGHGPALLARADLRLSLGAMTWPHMLVRVLIAEQLFRADSILSGHPYHRA